MASEQDALQEVAEALRGIAHRYRVNDDLEPFPDAEAWAARILAALADRGYHVTRSEGLDVERLARALSETVGRSGWLRSDPSDPVAEWRMNAAAIAREYGGTPSDREGPK